MIKKLHSTVQSRTPDLQLSDTAVCHASYNSVLRNKFQSLLLISNFPVFWMLYTFFWVIPQHLNCICQRLGTLSVPSS